MKRTAFAPLFPVIFLAALLSARSALGFGPATHATVAYHVAEYLGGPDPLLLAAFRGGANQPDLFTVGGYDWGLSHILELAEIMLEAAQTDEQRALAYGFACHIRADSAGHGHCIPDPTLEHTAVELSLDILLYHSPDPEESAAALESTVIWDAQFLHDAIAVYNARHGNPYPEISVEEINNLGDHHRSLLEAKNILYADPGWLSFAEKNAPRCWREECFNDAVTRSVDWIEAHPETGIFDSWDAPGRRIATPDSESPSAGQASCVVGFGALSAGPVARAADYTYPFESSDRDGDGVPDCGVRDNCPEIWNPEQTDGDGDGWGEACDCNDTNAAVNPGATEVPGNDLDDDCNPATPDQKAWSAANPANASECTARCLGESRVFNPLAPLLLSLGAVLVVRCGRRRIRARQHG